MLLGNKFSYDEFGLIHCCSAFNLCPDSPQLHKRPGISLEESQGAGWATCCRSLCLFSSVFRVCIYHQNEPVLVKGLSFTVSSPAEREGGDGRRVSGFSVTGGLGISRS